MYNFSSGFTECLFNIRLRFCCFLRLEKKNMALSLHTLFMSFNFHFYIFVRLAQFTLIVTLPLPLSLSLKCFSVQCKSDESKQSSEIAQFSRSFSNETMCRV